MKADSPERAGHRIGVFGGSFDPPHQAHIALAELAIEALGLDELHVIPTGDAWHKARALSAAYHRLAMTRLAFEHIPRVVVDGRELLRPGPSFTLDTLQALQLENPASSLYLIMGADQFSAFKKWHRWQAIVEIAIICIAGRAPFALGSADFDAYKELGGRLVELSLPPAEVSATEIRNLVVAGQVETLERRNLVPGAVARYISQNRLYLSS